MGSRGTLNLTASMVIAVAGLHVVLGVEFWRRGTSLGTLFALLSGK